MIIFSEKHSSYGNSLPDDDLDADDGFITRGWHKIPKEGDKAAEEICKANLIDLRSDNGENGLCIIHWQFLSFQSLFFWHNAGL
jgi:hypothetical protein